MHTPTPTGKPVHHADAEQLLDRLDRAMHLWARRDREPAALVDRALDELQAAWAAARMALGDDLVVDQPRRPERRATAPPAPRARRDVHRTTVARGRKGKDDILRERFIVQRYAALLRRGKGAREARELIAADIRQGRYVPNWQLRFHEDAPPYTTTYSERSVARVLKKYAAR
jgi:hypothetical protein